MNTPLIEILVALLITTLLFTTLGNEAANERKMTGGTAQTFFSLLNGLAGRSCQVAAKSGDESLIRCDAEKADENLFITE